MLPVNNPNNVRGFSLSSDKATGDQAPATLRLTGKPGLSMILHQNSAIFIKARSHCTRMSYQGEYDG